ncbi:MAG: helix-turn-helix domain-containing protein [bacterium]|nr:helix-turn-helix domain-containing protein [bacterium]
MKIVTKKAQREHLKRNEEKWSQTLMAAGWTALPSVILERQQGLGLEPLDLNILLQLARHWWYSDKLPYPSKKTIAACIGVHESTVRKRIARMEADGLIQRIERYKADGGQLSNFYSFDGLIKSASPYAEEVLETRKKRRAEDADRIRRKRPKKLTLVPQPADE